ncbi:MAG: Triose-phosphate Transporter [Chaenotheca gracillima]|nr:MAG: Triose-phosphate Transporter [Chaenotheca gracillima]
MADGKRLSVSGAPPKIPVATPNIGVVNTVPLETALVGCIGARIRVTTTLNQTFEGTLFTADPITNLIAINTTPPPPTPTSASTSAQPGDYVIIPISKLQNFQLVALAATDGGAAGAKNGTIPSTFEAALPSVRSIDMKALKAREKAAVEKELANERNRGKGVGQEAQDIYDALKRTLPVRWYEQSIIVSEAVMISPPYTVDDCKAAQKETNALQRVKKVLEMERKKLAERSNTTTGGANTPTTPAAAPAVRKGG